MYQSAFNGAILTDIDEHVIEVNEVGPDTEIALDIPTNAKRNTEIYEIYGITPAAFEANQRKIIIQINGINYESRTNFPSNDIINVVTVWYDQWNEVLKHRGVIIEKEDIFLGTVTEDQSLADSYITKTSRCRLKFTSRYPNLPLNIVIFEPVYARKLVLKLSDWSVIILI